MSVYALDFSYSLWPNDRGGMSTFMQFGVDVGLSGPGYAIGEGGYREDGPRDRWYVPMIWAYMEFDRYGKVLQPYPGPLSLVPGEGRYYLGDSDSEAAELLRAPTVDDIGLVRFDWYQGIECTVGVDCYERPVPEPSTYLLLLTGLLGMGLAYRRGRVA